MENQSSETSRGGDGGEAASSLTGQRGPGNTSMDNRPMMPQAMASLEEAPSDERAFQVSNAHHRAFNARPLAAGAAPAASQQALLPVGLPAFEPSRAHGAPSNGIQSLASTPLVPGEGFNGQDSPADRTTSADLYTAVSDADDHHDVTPAPSMDSSMQGGRLWQAAGAAAGLHASAHSGDAAASHETARNKRRGPGSRIAETFMFMDRTRSCANPNAPVANPNTKMANDGRQHMIRISEEEEALFLNTGLANKRVRVVQLLIIGLVALLAGWLGNFFVGTSCNFASVDVYVGQNAAVYSLHFGLWKYSPVDSAFNGYNYCYPYGENHKTDAPVVPRISNLAALLLGTYSLGVLWWYLITGRIVEKYWRWAERMAVVASVLQLSTLFFFVGRLCRRSKCTFGPASVVALVTAVAWLGLAWELHYNMPVPEKKEEPVPVVTNLEMRDLQGASQEYYERFSPRAGQGQYQPPSLS